MSRPTDRHSALGDFLRARRAELTPDMAGLPAGVQDRRVPGLRREEVAQLAAISTDYYTRLEQGRLPASETVVVALAGVLRLDGGQERYLRELARLWPADPRHQSASVAEATRRLMDDLAFSPALVLGRHMDILAWNDAARAMLIDFDALPQARRNYILLAFLEPSVRALYANWKADARICVAFLRMDAARYPDDPRLEEIVSEVSARDEDFRTWWADHQVADSSQGVKTFHHPLAGTLTLDWQMLAIADAPDQTLTVLSAAAGSPTRKALEALMTDSAAHRASDRLTHSRVSSRG
ncbi:helix-turn-helix domain-containing protein [Streptomyces sp. NPDC055709]